MSRAIYTYLMGSFFAPIAEVDYVLRLQKVSPAIIERSPITMDSRIARTPISVFNQWLSMSKPRFLSNR